MIPKELWLYSPLVVYSSTGYTINGWLLGKLYQFGKRTEPTRSEFHVGKWPPAIVAIHQIYQMLAVFSTKWGVGRNTLLPYLGESAISGYKFWGISILLPYYYHILGYFHDSQLFHFVPSGYKRIPDPGNHPDFSRWELNWYPIIIPFIFRYYPID